MLNKLLINMWFLYYELRSKSNRRLFDFKDKSYLRATK